MRTKPKYDKKFVEQCQRKALSVRKYAAKRYFFLHNCLDDIEAWVMLQYIEGRSLETRSNYLLTDYMRATFGDARADKFRGFWEFSTEQDNPTIKLIGADPRENFDNVLDNATLIKEMEMNLPFILTASECRVLRLYYFHDMDREQMAKVMGVTISRISQALKAAILKLRRFYNTHLTDF